MVARIRPVLNSLAFKISIKKGSMFTILLFQLMPRSGGIAEKFIYLNK